MIIDCFGVFGNVPDVRELLTSLVRMGSKVCNLSLTRQVGIEFKEQVLNS